MKTTQEKIKKPARKVFTIYKILTTAPENKVNYNKKLRTIKKRLRLDLTTQFSRIMIDK